MLSNKLKAKLAGLAANLGHMGIVESLPDETIINATSHGDQIVGLTDNRRLLELIGITGDYTVFNKRLQPIYTATPTDTNVWGASDIDLVWFVQVPVGGYFYIAYNDGSRDRLILVVRS